ncbi:hypothetical protein J1G42_04135 [Cellulomonas sp. zg-ZUI222]|uniref:hypothetical protein n=1 Tax=Cellulomonas wangleii TaxID=2816956 RepID=UPI001A93CB1F|nr:hypothetical protein [Cellulomonas wangleii]MBO0920011.1 hypothetical protein [Cellulomonas wangleii]
MNRRADRARVRAARAREVARAQEALRARQATLAQQGVVARRLTRAQRRAARRDRVRALPPHLRRRRRLRRWSAVPVVLLLVFAFTLLLLGPRYAEARAAYDEDRTWEALELFEELEGFALVERWKGPFNSGTARYRAGMPRLAVEHLDRALELVPDEHRCTVQTNRILALTASEEETTERAEEQLAYAQAVADALAAQEAAEPYDAEVLEPPYEGADPPVVSDELWYAGYLFRRAADDAAMLAEALADPACTPPPSQGGGGGEDDDAQGGGGGEDDQQGGGGQDQQDGDGQDQQDGDGQDQQDGDGQDQQGGGGQDEQGEDDPAAAAERRMQELFGTSTELENLGRAAEEGTLEGRPEPGRGQQQAPDPAQAEAQRRQELAERNGQSGGGSGGQQQGPAGGTGTAPGGGDGPGTGGGTGGRNW